MEEVEVRRRLLPERDGTDCCCGCLVEVALVLVLVLLIV